MTDNLQAAARSLEQGKTSLAAIHLAHAGLQRLVGEERVGKRLFMIEQCLDAGSDPAELLKGLDLLPAGMEPWELP